MISIVTAYHNRKKLFIKTLESFQKSSFNDFEVIAVDDCSHEDERLEDLTEKFPFLKIVRLEKKDKWYVNPCVPFNIGFKHASGDKIIIQNPECLHSDDILNFVNENLTENNYLSFGCYSLNEIQTSTILQLDEFKGFVNPSTYKTTRILVDGDEGWYNHSIYRPKSYHFCTAITKKDLEELGGFDERFAEGVAFDDDEFVHRISLKLNIIFVDNLVAYHLWHYANDKNATVTNKVNMDGKFWEMWNRNSYLFNYVTKVENKYTVNN
jgi:glycosyltransferase involved in cell wall biosynthesis